MKNSAKTNCLACKKEMMITAGEDVVKLEIEGQFCGVVCDDCAERYNRGEIEMRLKVSFVEADQGVE